MRLIHSAIFWSRFQTTIISFFLGFLCLGFLSISSIDRPLAFELDKKNYQFSLPESLKFTSSNLIHLIVLAQGIDGDQFEAFRMRKSLQLMMNSLLTRSQKMPIHLIFITEATGIPILTEMFLKEHPPEQIYSNIGVSIPRFVLEFIDVDVILNHVRKWNKQMKKYFNNHGGVFNIIRKVNGTEEEEEFQMTYTEKYNSDIFYILPFYHKIFPQLSKIVIVDADVVFNVDIAKLYGEFAKFDKDQLLGAGNDLAPHYHQLLYNFRKLHPETKIGNPGRFQGLNVGVVLLDLDKIRRNSLYNQFLQDEEITRIATKYQMNATHLGEQDWLTLVSFEAPHLIYPLSCLFNRQLGKDYYQDPWKDIFSKFHACHDGDQEPYIVHGNSDSLL